jgi:hypothetical protein
VCDLERVGDSRVAGAGLNVFQTPGPDPGSGTPAARWRAFVVWLTLAAVLWLAVGAGAELSRICTAGRGLPQWDNATHGLAGVDLAHAIRSGDVPGFLAGINRQALWPPVHSLLLFPWFLALGDDYATANRLSSILFPATILVLYLAGLKLHPRRGAWVGAAAAVLALLSPLYRLFGTLCMLEMPGAFLLSLAVCCHVWAGDPRAPRAMLAAAGASSAALFLCKYNYGLLWLAPLAAHEWLALPLPRRAACVAHARTWLGSRRWLRPFPLFMLVYLLVLAAILVTGGGVIEVMGVRVSIRSPGNPAYLFYVLALGSALLHVRRTGGWRAAWQRIDPRERILATTLVLPLALYLLIPYPNRIKELFGFITNRDSGPSLWSLDGLLFYPRAFAGEYCLSPGLGWVVLALALLPPRRCTAKDPRRLAYLALWVGLLATAAHHYRQPRFLFTTAALVWLNAARTAVALLDAALARWRMTVPREAVWACGIAALLVWAGREAPSAATTLTQHRAWNSPAMIEPVLECVLDQVERTGPRTVLLGYSNRLSPALLAWQRRLTHPAIPDDRLPGKLEWLPADAGESAILERIAALRRSGAPVIAALADDSLEAQGAEYLAETRTDRLIVARLRTDPGIQTEFETQVPGSGFKVSLFRFAPQAADPPRTTPGPATLPNTLPAR